MEGLGLGRGDDIRTSSRTSFDAVRLGIQGATQLSVSNIGFVLRTNSQQPYMLKPRLSSISLMCIYIYAYLYVYYMYAYCLCVCVCTLKGVLLSILGACVCELYIYICYPKP